MQDVHPEDKDRRQENTSAGDKMIKCSGDDISDKKTQLQETK